MRTIEALALALTLSACATGGVGPGRVDALWRWRDRDVALAPSGEDELSEGARRGAAAGLARGGVTPAEHPAPGALVVEARALGERDGERIGTGSREVARAIGGPVEGAVGLLAYGERALTAHQVRIELVLRAPDRREPIGGVVWEGWRGDEPAATAERAGEEAGEALARAIVRERERMVTRRVADERMVLTPTPLLLAPGEIALSDDEVVLVHVGVGVSRWLQVDLTLGGVPLPAAGGIAYAGDGGVAGAGGAGAAVVGLVAPGVKLRVLEEGPWWPGVSAAYDLVDVWGAALGGGSVGILGRGVAGAAGGVAAGANVPLNVFSFAAAKHFADWFQVGGGSFVIDDHHLLPQRAGFVAGGGTTAGTGAGTSGSTVIARLPTALVPYLNAEAAAGQYFRFIGEYLFAPGDGYLTLGIRTLVPLGRRVGAMRAGGSWLKLDTALVITGYESERTGQHRTTALPWLGVGLYMP
jgi:hypothetical protein